MEIDWSNVLVFKWHELNYIKVETDIGIAAFKTLTSNQELSLESTKSEFDERFKNDSLLNSLEPEEQGSYYTQIYEIEERTIEDLQRRQRYAILLTILSFFKGHLQSICNQIEATFDFKIKIDDLNSQEYLKQYWNYLVKVFGMDKTNVEPSFTPLRQLKIIRNIIAHQDGYIKRGQKNQIKKGEGLILKDIGDNCIIEITDTSYILEIISKMETFFEKLLLAIDKRYKEQRNPQNNLIAL